MNKLRQKKQQILRLLFGAFSFTAVMLVFQACYGPPSEGLREDLIVDDTVACMDQDSLKAENAVQEESAYMLENDGEE